MLIDLEKAIEHEVPLRDLQTLIERQMCKMAIAQYKTKKAAAKALKISVSNIHLDIAWRESKGLPSWREQHAARAAGSKE